MSNSPPSLALPWRIRGSTSSVLTGGPGTTAPSTSSWGRTWQFLSNVSYERDFQKRREKEKKGNMPGNSTHCILQTLLLLQNLCPIFLEVFLQVDEAGRNGQNMFMSPNYLSKSWLSDSKKPAYLFFTINYLY